MILGLILLDDTQASFNEWLSQNAVYLAFALAGFILLCVLLLLFIPVAKKKKKSKKAVIAKTQTMDALGGEENVLSHLRKGSRIELKLKNYDLLKKDELKEAGVDGFIAECKPEDKIDVIKKEQAEGKIVAMTGDGTDHAPALAQANVGLAMNSGTTAAKEAANMVDLDSDPTKILEVVEIGKQLLITRGSLTTFSIANDIAKYFAIIPAMFMMAIPQLGVLNIMDLATPHSAILSALIFNAIIIPCLILIPLALRGVAYKPIGASALLRRNLLIYGVGGVIAPFAGIKLIDMLIHPLLALWGF